LAKTTVPAKKSPVSTRPVKRFFVEMLTRDIALEDAILDLLDNCVDGVQRSLTKKQRQGETPYKGFKAEITFSASRFVIADNCGGIPWSEHDRAFRMGNPSANRAAMIDGALLVGTYGIGMKRAIFKMGRSAVISTRTNDDAYDVTIPTGWTDEEDDWELAVTDSANRLKHSGTSITIEDLTATTSSRFRSSDFLDALLEKIETHYSVILTKGFSVTVNNRVAKPKRIAVKFAELSAKSTSTQAAIRPYIFRSGNEDDVEVFVAVGLREPIPDAETTLDEQEGATFATDFAGWTVICNDRVVLYCNRDELTGWGTANIPRYHTQFIAISGFVEFKGNAAKLPTTTTKRGLEFSSVLYQQVLNRMRDGTRMFIDYTNWWKQNEAHSKQQVQPLPSKTMNELKEMADSATIKFNPTRTGLAGEIYKPNLPKPISEAVDLRVAFYRPKRVVMRLAEELLRDFEDISEKNIPRSLGEHLFDEAHSKIGKKVGNK